jgi:hypothetical protein
MIERATTAADLGIKAHAHMLRHACGYKLANDGHDTRAIQAARCAICWPGLAELTKPKGILRSRSRLRERHGNDMNNIIRGCRLSDPNIHSHSQRVEGLAKAEGWSTLGHSKCVRRSLPMDTFFLAAIKG